MQGEKWDLDKLLTAISKNAGEECSLIALDIYKWISPLVSRIWWSDAKIDGSFIPTWDGTNSNHWFFALRSTGKIELYLAEIAKKPPFNNTELRQEFIDRFNSLGASIPSGKHNLYPKFSLEIISLPEKLKEFKNIIEWALEEVKRIEV